MTQAYDPLTGEHWDRDAAQRAWEKSMGRVHRERHAPLRWQLHGSPGSWRWVFFNFGPWTGEITIEPDGFHWHTRSYGTGHIRHKGITTSVYEAFQSVEQNQPVKREQ